MGLVCRGASQCLQGDHVGMQLFHGGKHQMLAGHFSWPSQFPWRRIFHSSSQRIEAGLPSFWLPAQKREWGTCHFQVDVHLMPIFSTVLCSQLCLVSLNPEPLGLTSPPSSTADTESGRGGGWKQTSQGRISPHESDTQWAAECREITLSLKTGALCSQPLFWLFPWAPGSFTMKWGGGWEQITFCSLDSVNVHFFSSFTIGETLKLIMRK